MVILITQRFNDSQYRWSQRRSVAGHTSNPVAASHMHAICLQRPYFYYLCLKNFLKTVAHSSRSLFT
jgi:hypothetical protein